MNKVSLLASALVAVSFSAGITSAATIYSDDFSGAAATPLNGQAEDTAGAIWSANNFVNADGSINGANEGSAILPMNPKAYQKVTVSMDVFMPAGVDRWVALGFMRDGLIAPGTNNINDRPSNEAEGIAWMLFRDAAGGTVNDVQAFAGLRTAGQIADNDAAFSFGQFNRIAVSIDAGQSGQSSSFVVDFFVNGVSILAAPVTINTLGNPGNSGPASPPLDVINYVGFGFDNATTNTTLRVDNFLVTIVPEPMSATAIAGGAALLAGRRRRCAK